MTQNLVWILAILFGQGEGIDPRLVAAGYDKNRNGIVSDELDVTANIDFNKDGKITVGELSSALEKWKVVVSGGVVQAQKPGTVPHFPRIDILSAIRKTSKDYSMVGDAEYPAWKYRETRTRSDGSTYVYYRWKQAIVDLRGWLEAVRAIAGLYPYDSHSKAIHQVADQALQQNPWSEWLHESEARGRYKALYTALQSIYLMSEAPPQPQRSVNGMAKAVNEANGHIGALRNVLKDPRIKSAHEKTSEKVAELRIKAASVPWWQYLLFFGIFKRWGLETEAARMEGNLAVLKTANPNALQRTLSEVARDAYEILQQAWAVKNLEEAQSLAHQTDAIVQTADGIGTKAAIQSKGLRNLLDRLER